MGGSYPRPRDWPLAPEQEPPSGACAIKLTQHVVAWVDEQDYRRLSDGPWQAQWAPCAKAWYAVRSIATAVRGRNAVLRMHRVVLGVDQEVDHREHFPRERRVVDNRRSNLRACTRQENTWNARRRRHATTSRFIGVNRTWDGKWEASIRVGARRKYLGRFSEERYAALARDYAVRQLRGAFGVTNFPTVESATDTLTF